MDALTISAASGIRARMESLEMLANNIANQATAGFKADREFYSLYVSPEAESAGGRSPATLPVVERHWTDFSPGTLTPTNSPLDLALSGSGFFAVAGPSGPLYTRNGNFRLSPGGRLETQEGFAVLGGDLRPIRLDPSLPVEVDASGGVMQQGAAIAELGVFRVGSQETLRKRAGTYFEATSPDPPPREESPTVHQGKLEAANFSAPEAAVRLVSVMRQFETLQRAAQLAGEMSRRAIEEVARVGS